nr:basic proline-rich protein-like [Aegilops tauschii subsp. strangulata]
MPDPATHLAATPGVLLLPTPAPSLASVLPAPRGHAIAPLPTAPRLAAPGRAPRVLSSLPPWAACGPPPPPRRSGRLPVPWPPVPRGAGRHPLRLCPGDPVPAPVGGDRRCLDLDANRRGRTPTPPPAGPPHPLLLSIVPSSPGHTRSSSPCTTTAAVLSVTEPPPSSSPSPRRPPRAHCHFPATVGETPRLPSPPAGRHPPRPTAPVHGPSPARCSSRSRIVAPCLTPRRTSLPHPPCCFSPTPAPSLASVLPAPHGHAIAPLPTAPRLTAPGRAPRALSSLPPWAARRPRLRAAPAACRCRGRRRPAALGGTRCGCVQVTRCPHP